MGSVRVICRLEQPVQFFIQGRGIGFSGVRLQSEAAFARRILFFVESQFLEVGQVGGRLSGRRRRLIATEPNWLQRGQEIGGLRRFDFLHKIDEIDDGLVFRRRWFRRRVSGCNVIGVAHFVLLERGRRVSLFFRKIP
jgi:hypothetical protein